MALLSQSKTLAGSRAFSGLRARVTPVISNGSSKVTMRKDTYMVEVNVGEDEPEDIAVRRFMKKVMESGVIDELRNRRYKETPLQEWKRRTRERIAARKMGLRMTTWVEEYGDDNDHVLSKPFGDFFEQESADSAAFLNGFLQYGNMAGDSGGYMDGAWGQAGAGTYMGGYMTPDQTGSYAQPGGGYMSPPDASAYGGYAAPAVDAYGNPIYAAPAVDAYGNPIYADPAAYAPQPDYQQPGYAQPPPQQGGYQ